MDTRRTLDKLIKEREETYSGISRLLGRNAAYIQQYIKRKTPACLDQSDIAQIALHFDVPAKSLGGKEQPRCARRAVLSIPILGAENAANDHERFRQVDEAWLNRMCSWPAGTALLFVVGEAMQPTLLHGDEVIIQRLRPGESLRDGLFAIQGSSETFVRRIALDPSKDRISVLTDHPSYPSWNGMQRKSLKVVGRVIWHGGRIY